MLQMWHALKLVSEKQQELV